MEEMIVPIYQSEKSVINNDFWDWWRERYTVIFFHFADFLRKTLYISSNEYSNELCWVQDQSNVV